MRPKPKIIDAALKPKPAAEYVPSGTWHDDGMKIVALLESKLPEHQAAIAKLTADCPHKYSIDIRTGKKTEVRAHTIAAWAGKRPELVQRLKSKGLI